MAGTKFSSLSLISHVDENFSRDQNCYSFLQNTASLKRRLACFKSEMFSGLGVMLLVCPAWVHYRTVQKTISVGPSRRFVLSAVSPPLIALALSPAKEEVPVSYLIGISAPVLSPPSIRS